MISKPNLNVWQLFFEQDPEQLDQQTGKTIVLTRREQMKRWIPIFVIAALAVGGFAAFGAIDQAYAQAGSSAAADVNAGVFARGGRGNLGYTDEELAAALGITTDELTTARTEAKAAALAQAVEDGLITQAQADEIAANGSAFPFGGRWGGWLSAQGLDFDTYLADALEISTEELAAARAEALDAHLAALVADGRITQDQADLMKARFALTNSETFRSDLQSAFESALAKAVADGTITQAQADLLLAERAERPGLGLRGGFDGFGGMGGGCRGR